MNDLRKRMVSLVVSLFMTGSSSALVSAPVFADDSTDTLTKVEQEHDETKKELKEEVQETEKEEQKEEVQETEKEEQKEEVQEEQKEEVKEEVKEVEKEEQKEEVKEPEKEEVKEVEEKEQKEEVKEPEKGMVQVTRFVKNAADEEKTNTTEEHEEHKVSCITTKVDENGNPLSGAVLQILDKDGNVVDEWVSDGTEHETMLPEGEYTLHEVSAPEGYSVAPDKTFTVVVEVKDMDAGVDFSETPCSHYGGTPLYYIESEGERSEVYCINQDWETPDENSQYDGKVITPIDIKTYTQQTVYIDAYQTKEIRDISDPTLSSQELYDKILDIIYHRQKAAELFPDLTEAEIRYVTESALKNYTNAGLTRVQRVGINQAPTGYENTDYYITDDEKYMWYLYPWYRSFVYNPDAELGEDVFTTDIGNGDAFGTLARHWSTGHNAKNDPEVREKLKRYYALYQYLTNDRERHPDDMHLYIFYTDDQSLDLSGYDFDHGAYQNLLGIRWFDPYDENYKVYLMDVNESIKTPDEPEKPDKPEKPDEPEKPDKPEKPEKSEKPKKPSVPAKKPQQYVKNSSPKTGDPYGASLPLSAGALVMSGAALGALVRKRKRF